MRAVGAVNNAGVAGLTALVIAPVLEGFDHLTGVYALVLGCLGGSACLKKIIGELFESLLRGVVAGEELAQQLCGLGLRRSNELLIRGVADRNQNVADILGDLVMGVTADEVDDIVAAFAFDAVGVALGTRGVKQPLGDVGRAGAVELVAAERRRVIFVVALGILGSIGKCLLGEGLLVADRGKHGVGVGLGGSHLEGALLFLLFLGKFFAALILSGIAALGKVERTVGNAVIVVGVCRILSVDLLGGIGACLIEGRCVVLRNGADTQELLIALEAAACAEAGNKERVGVVVAVKRSVAAERGKLGLKRRFLLLGQRKAVCNGFVIDGIALCSGLKTLLNEIVIPALLLVGIDILLAGAWTVFLLRKSDCISVQNPLYLEKQAGFMQKP